MDGFCDSVRDVNEALLDTFWNSSDYPETAQLLNEYSIVNDQVFEAVKLNRCYFPLLKADFQKPENYDEVAGLWYHYSDYARHLRYIGKFILLSANNDVSEGKYDLGLKKYFSVLQMARHLRQQSELIDILVGMAFERKTFRCINRFLITCDLPPDYRRNIKKILGDVTYDWKADMQNVFEREKLRNKSLMYAIFYQINESGSIRYNRDPNSTLPAIIHICPTLEDPDQFQILLNSHPQAQSYLHKKATKASLLLTSFFVPLDINKTEKIFDKNLASHDEMLSSDYYWSKEDKRFMFTWTTVKINFSFFSKMMFEGIMAEYYERIHEIFLETRAAKQSTQIIVALEQYENKTGHWPESLDVISDQVPDGVLIDPMNGRTFVYRTEGDSFIFYSRGKNDEDEYNQLVRWYTDDPNEFDSSLRRPDDIAIWPHIDN